MDQTMFIISAVVIALGYLGIFLPILPGLPVIFVGILVYGLLTGFVKVSLGWILVFAGIAAIGFVGDQIVSLFTVKKMGASREGILGAVFGGLIGVVIGSLPGLLLGQFVGMVGGEFYGGKRLPPSLRSGVGVLVGYVLGTAFKLTVASLMTFLFVWLVLFT